MTSRFLQSRFNLHLSRLILLLMIAMSLAFAANCSADGLQDTVAKPILDLNWTLLETQRMIHSRIPKLTSFSTKAQWDRYATDLRERFLSKVVYRGPAASWRNANLKVEMLESVAGGVGYRMQKLRFEAVPGMWIPAILYTPDKIIGSAPLSLAVNGHDPVGKAAGYKQIRCINMAKRGMIVLNLEWFGMGQLALPGFDHEKMNQLDLCGATGLAPFYHAMKRGLDILLEQPNADPNRIVVSGLSGGGWQTIFISALDPRVTLANPVAGYSSFFTRLVYWKDLGDSEQAPCDMALVGDYTHLTALRAPRTTLLTYNATDNCCFESGYALPPLEAAARPIYRLYGNERNLRTHVNINPGTHNFEQDNREALYQTIGDRFFATDANFSDREIPCEKEIKSATELQVPLPASNLTFNTLAKSLAKSLPHNSQPSSDRAALANWQIQKRDKLKEVTKWSDMTARAQVRSTEKIGELTVTKRRLTIAEKWTIPVIEITPANPSGTAILFSELGRAACLDRAKERCKKGDRVLVTDLYYFGECGLPAPNSRWANFVEAVGDRLIGIQTGELCALAKWANAEFRQKPFVEPVGARAGLIGLIACAINASNVTKLELPKNTMILRDVIERDLTVDKVPELFCYQMLEHFDNQILQALANIPN